MITYVSGNLLQAKVECLVNTVNCVGISGKGIALQFKIIFPDNYKLYREACLRGEVRVGKMYVVDMGRDFPHYIINFPTKMHWRYPSKLEWVRDGLDDLAQIIPLYRIKSIAIPALGCSCGGLDWDIVRPLIEEKLSPLEVAISVYNPL